MQFFKIINVARKIAFFRSATQFAKTFGSLGEAARFQIIEGENLSCGEGNALKIVGFIFHRLEKEIDERGTL